MNKRERKVLAEFFVALEKRYSKLQTTDPKEEYHPFHLTGMQKATGEIKREFQSVLENLQLDYTDLLTEFGLWERWLEAT